MPWHTHSLKQLVLLAFFLAAVPLAVLVYQSGNALVTQSAQARLLAREMLESSQRNEQLRTLTEDIIRAARQYDIVNRAEVRQRLEQNLNDYAALLDLADSSAAPTLPRSDLHQLLTELRGLSTLEQPPRFASGRLEQLMHETQQLIRANDAGFNDRLELLEQRVQQEQLRTGWFAVLLIATSTALILFFSGRINRPVQQLIRHIRNIGEGERTPQADLSGPEELAQVNTQLNWLAQHLESLEQDKVRFLQHVSHELKTPLTTLREGADLLAEELAGPLTADQHEIIQLLQQNSLTLQELIEQLLDYNRLQQPGQVQLENVVIPPLVQRIMRPFKLQIEQKQLQVSTRFEFESCHTDAQMLQRVLSNLISNAVHYSDQQGTLSISACRNGNALELKVANSGPLIPNEDVPMLFEPFYQGKNRRRGPLKGSGIGLSIAQQASRALGAKLVLSENENARVAFTLTLPPEDA
ncbi:two component system sensor histidine kinase QseE/GlrK [Marinobacterium sp. BA1]